nr:hypothetical protein [Hyphomonas sp. Mor2]
MIIQPARIVVIDNNSEHLKALVDALSGLGSACLPFHYQDAHPERHLLAGARFIFCDLHLISDAVTSDKQKEYANIASMLLEALRDDHGPYVLVIWSEYPDDVEALKRYVAELEDGKKPLLVHALNKNDYIHTNANDGEFAGNLVQAVAELFQSLPGLAAMLQWEQIVSDAAAQTTSSLWSHCTGDTTARRDESLSNTLGKLANGASGERSAKVFPGRSVISALNPLLADQLEQNEIDETIWKEAVQFKKADFAASDASLYTMLHVECPTSHNATERGALVELPKSLEKDKAFEAVFGYDRKSIIHEFGYRGERLDDAVKQATWCCLQINAACDQAQGHPGLVPYTLSCFVPTAIKKREGKRDSVFQSRGMVIDEIEQFLFSHGRFTTGMTQRRAIELKPLMRLRGQLLDQAVFDIRVQAARLGTIEPFRSKNP